MNEPERYTVSESTRYPTNSWQVVRLCQSLCDVYDDELDGGEVTHEEYAEHWEWAIERFSAMFEPLVQGVEWRIHSTAKVTNNPEVDELLEFEDDDFEISCFVTGLALRYYQTEEGYQYAEPLFRVVDTLPGVQTNLWEEETAMMPISHVIGMGPIQDHREGFAWTATI